MAFWVITANALLRDTFPAFNISKSYHELINCIINEALNLNKSFVVLSYKRN